MAIGERDRWMARIPLGEIWGVGSASQAELAAIGSTTVADVRDLDCRRARRGMTVVGQRIVHELRGECCLDLGTIVPTRKGYAVTRSFSQRVRSRDDGAGGRHARDEARRETASRGPRGPTT